MRLKYLLVVAMLGSCAVPPPGPPVQVTELAGRSPGAPRDCLPLRPTENVRFADDRATLIYGSGKTIWVNALGPACSFPTNDIPVFEPTVSSYCRGDIVRSVDRDSGISGPSCVLGEFVPFTRR